MPLTLTNGYVGGYRIKNDMNNAGSTDIAVAIALKTLTNKGLIESELWNDRDDEPYMAYKATEKGEQWLITNQDKLCLTAEPRVEPSQVTEEEPLPF